MNTLYLAHHGVKGQKWGVRRYQNYDGTRIKYNSDGSRIIKKGSLVSRVSNSSKDPTFDNKNTYLLQRMIMNDGKKLWSMTI